MQYQWREHYRAPKGITAGTVAQETDRLRIDGELTAGRLVEASRPKAAPLHAAFEWDNRQAAESYRLIQARTLIRAVVVIHSEDEAPESLYVHVRPNAEDEETEGKYMPLRAIIGDADEYERALMEAQRFLTSAQRRFEELRRLAMGRGDRTEALTIALEGFSTVQRAVELLKVA